MTSSSVRRFFFSNARFSLLAAAILTLISVLLWFYESYYYALLRLAVCFISAYCAYVLKLQNRALYWVLILIAFLFNPIFTIVFFGQAFAAIVITDLMIAVFFLWMAKQPRMVLDLSRMGSNGQLRRILLAGCASLTIVFAMASNIRFVSSEDELTTYDQIINYLGMPAFWLFYWVTGREIDVLSHLFELLVITFLIYMLVIWGILSLAEKTGKFIFPQLLHKSLPANDDQRN